MASLNTAAQVASPGWVRARVMSVYLLVLWGGFAAGGVIWGTIASNWGVSISLMTSAVGLLVASIATMRFKLTSDDAADLTPSMHWADPAIAIELHPEHGPVMVTVEYRVRSENSAAFTAAIHALGRIRRRDGAVQWGVFSDVSDPDRYVETFIVESWAEHLRQHERVTVADRSLEEKVHSFHIGPEPPGVSHFIYSEDRT